MKQHIRILSPIYRTTRRFLHRYINGTRGVISLFLALLMVPFLSVAGALLNAARINSAVAVFDEALCNASNSTLGTYDDFLKSRFGLLAMSQNTAIGGIGYTPQQLISDTFQEYMRVNMGALSNTYFDAETSAAGIYPLSDPDVLHSQVNEFSKFSIPTQLVIEGLSLESIINGISKCLDPLKSYTDTANSLTKAGDSCVQANDKADSLKKDLANAKEMEAAKNTAYEDFCTAVDDYNSAVSALTDYLDSASTQESPSDAADIDSEDTSAETAGETVDQEEEYRDDVASARKKLEDAKNAYVKALGNYKAAIKTVGDTAVAFSSAFSGIFSNGADVIQGVTSITFDTMKKSSEVREAELNQQITDATAQGDTAKVNQLNQELTEVQSSNKDYDKVTPVVEVMKKKSQAKKDLIMGSTDFFNRDLVSEFNALYALVRDVQVAVQNDYTIPTQDTEEASDALNGYSVNVDLGITPEEIDDLLLKMGSTVFDSTSFGFIKAIIGFFKALLTLNLDHNWELISTVDGSYYADQGGLPSKRDRTDSRYSLTSEFDQEDRELSQHYRDLLSDYGGGSAADSGVFTLEGIFANILGHIDTISDCIDNLLSPDFLLKMGELIVAITGIFVELGRLVGMIGTLVTDLLSSSYRKMLLAGYIGYNIPNRTTYTGYSLTQSCYTNSLPSIGDNSGMGFWGAEAEYIISGGSSEKDNQNTLFSQVYLIRAICDAPAVFMNKTVQSFASAAAEATAVIGGIGGLLVFLGWILAEPLVDTVLMVNGRSVPLFKTTTLYLSPRGIPSLIKDFTFVPLTAGGKKTVEDKLNSLIDKIDPSIEHVSFSQASSQPSLSLDSFRMDYTKALVLIMIFLGKTDEMLLRLADVIQMEATCNAKNTIGSYDFNLDHSYTYLRASGHFDAHEFIKLSDTGILTSTDRVVYRGY